MFLPSISCRRFLVLYSSNVKRRSKVLRASLHSFAFFVVDVAWLEWTWALVGCLLTQDPTRKTGEISYGTYLACRLVTNNCSILLGTYQACLSVASFLILLYLRNNELLEYLRGYSHCSRMETSIHHATNKKDKGEENLCIIPFQNFPIRWNK